MLSRRSDRTSACGDDSLVHDRSGVPSVAPDARSADASGMTPFQVQVSAGSENRRSGTARLVVPIRVWRPKNGGARTRLARTGSTGSPSPMTADGFAWQTDDNGLLIVEYEHAAPVFDDVNGTASNGGVAALRQLGFEPVGSDLTIATAPAGTSLELVSDDEAVLVLRLPDGRVFRDAFRHDHPEWTVAVRSLGFAPTVVSFGGGLLPEATTERIQRHARAGDLLGGSVAASG